MRGAYDFETWEWVNPLCCGFAWGATGERKHHFIRDRSTTNPKAVAQAALFFMHSLPEVETWWAHNGGKYDSLFMLDAAQSLGWTATAQVAGGSRCIELRLKPPKTKRAIVLRDSYAVAQSSLKSCAKDFELPSQKLFTPDDYSKDVRTWPLDRLREGCLIDCDLVLELLEKIEGFLEGWGGDLKTTFSSSALSVVKAQLATKGIEIPSHKGNQQANAYSRKGFYGARVEVFRHAPTEWLTEFDVTSSYPWAMTQSLPWEYQGVASKAGLAALMSGEREGMVRARVKVPETYFPCLPYRAKDGGIFFPTGDWESIFPACELRYALTRGVKVEPLEGLVYSKASPFEDFVADLFELKARSGGAVRSFAKLCLNGVFGKWGQSPERDELLVCSDEKEALETILAAPPGTIGRLSADPRFLTKKIFRWPKQTHYALASYITGFARVHMHRGLLRTVNPAYCDSDAIHCARGSSLGSLEGGALGQWKVEVKKFKGEYFAPKLYRLTEPNGKLHLAAKGFPVSREIFEKLVQLEQVPVERMQLMRTQLRGLGTVGRVSEYRKWSGRSMKRRVLPDGNTLPWTVAELIKACYEDSLSPIQVNAA